MQISIKANVDAAKFLAAKIHPTELEAVFVKALRKAMGPVVKDLQAAAPVGPSSISKGHLAGQLRRSLRLRVGQRRGLRVSIVAAPHAHLVEGGHRIVRGGKTFGRVQAHPFIKPTIDAALPEVEATIHQEIDRYLDQAARVAKVTGRVV